MTGVIRLTVNGAPHEVEVPTYRTLLDCLRNDLGLTGSKEGCGVGVCGACTVLLDANPHPSDDEIREWMAGNLCRCTGYYKILESIRTAADRSRA